LIHSSKGRFLFAVHPRGYKLVGIMAFAAGGGGTHRPAAGGPPVSVVVVDEAWREQGRCIVIRLSSGACLKTGDALPVVVVGVDRSEGMAESLAPGPGANLTYLDVSAEVTPKRWDASQGGGGWQRSLRRVALLWTAKDLGYDASLGRQGGLPRPWEISVQPLGRARTSPSGFGSALGGGLGTMAAEPFSGMDTECQSILNRKSGIRV